MFLPFISTMFVNLLVYFFVKVSKARVRWVGVADFISFVDQFSSFCRKGVVGFRESSRRDVFAGSSLEGFTKVFLSFVDICYRTGFFKNFLCEVVEFLPICFEKVDVG